jgi:hypothetical protein
MLTTGSATGLVTARQGQPLPRSYPQNDDSGNGPRRSEVALYDRRAV